MTKRRILDYKFSVSYPYDGGSDDVRWLTLLPDTAGPAPTLPLPIAIKLGKSEDGRLVCIGMRLGADAIPGYDPSASAQITSRILHEIPLGQILDHLATWRILPVDTTPDPGAEYRKPRSHPGRRGHPRAFYEGIARLYREALVASPRHVYRYIVEHAADADGSRIYPDTERDDIRESREAVARRWVSKARRMGLLGPARRGVAGEYRDN